MAEDRASRIIVTKDLEMNSVEDVFYRYKALLIDALRQNLIEADKDQPGSLIQSIDVLIQEKGSTISFELSMEDYWKWVDAGRKPGAKMPPIKDLLDFIKVRGIAGKPKQVKAKNKTVRKALKQVNRDKALKQVAFAIGISIKRKGIKPTHFYSSVVTDDLKSKLKADLSKALARDIEINIKESFT